MSGPEVLEVHEFGVPEDGWAIAIVQTSAWLHVAATDHRGWVLTSSGRARCGACGWRLSARLEDVRDEASARFALFALATIGGIIAAVHERPPRAQNF